MATMSAAHAEEFVPPCGIEKVDGRFVYDIEKLPNRFAAEHSTDDIPDWNRIDLVHCPSGQTMRADFRAVGEHDPRPVDDHFAARMSSRKGITQERLAEELRARGAKTRIFKSRKEACACQKFHPETVGSKTPFVEVWE